MNTWRPVFITLLALLSIALLGCTQERTSPSPTATTAAATGKAVFAITDDAKDLGAISKINLTVDSIRVHAQSGGWVTLTSTPQTFDLLELKAKGVASLLAEANLAPGDYDQIELSISKITVVDAEGEHEAKLPSGKLQLKGELKIEAGAISTANFDFLADQSLHVTGQGQYIFAPVIHLETRAKATAQISTSKEVRISGGSKHTDDQLGMDIEGSVDAGIRIAPDAVLSITAGGKVTQTKGQAFATGTLKAVDAANGAVTITTRAGTELTLYLASDTEVKASGSSKTTADLSSRIGAEAVVRYNAETKALSKIIVASDHKGKAEISADMGISGSIKSVDIRKGTVTVRTDSGAEVTMKLESESRINMSGKATGLAGLEGMTGTRIKINYDAGSGKLKEIKGKAEFETEAQVTGTLKEVNLADGTVTVTTAAGADVTIKIASTSKVMANGSLSPLARLKALTGSQVTLEYDQETKVVRELHARGKSEGAVDVTGVIKAVNPAQGTVTITTPGGQDVVLNVTAASALVADGTIASVAGLQGKVGTELRVEYDSKSNVVLEMKARAKTNANATGTLKGVDVQNGIVVVATPSGEVTLHVDASAELEAGGEDISLEELARLVGTEVKAEFNAQIMAATEIKAQSSAKAVGKVTGKIAAVDTAAGTITITLEAGGSLTLRLATDTMVHMTGSLATRDELAAKVGSRVVAEYSPDTNFATRIVVVGEGSTRAAVAGNLKSVNAPPDSIVIEPAGGGEVALRVTDRTKILIQGKISSPLELLNLVGTHVVAQYDVQSSAAIGIEARGFSGDRLTAVGALESFQGGVLTVVLDSGAKATFRVGGQFALKLRGSVGTDLPSLANQVGARVRVSYDPQTMIAYEVEVEAKTTGAGSGSGGGTGGGSGGGGRGTGESGGGSGGAGGTAPEPREVPTATPTGGPAGTSVSLSGTIKAVNVLNGMVTIAVQGGADVVLNATATSRLSLPLARLVAQVGSQVRVSYDAKTMAIISLSVES